MARHLTTESITVFHLNLAVLHADDQYEACDV